MVMLPSLQEDKHVMNVSYICYVLSSHLLHPSVSLYEHMDLFHK